MLISLCCILTGPITVLVLGPNRVKHAKYFSNVEDGVLCENITYLGI